MRRYILSGKIKLVLKSCSELSVVLLAPFFPKTTILEKEDLVAAFIKTDGKSLFFVTGLQLETLAPRDPTSKD